MNVSRRQRAMKVDAVILMGGNIRGGTDYPLNAFFSLEGILPPCSPSSVPLSSSHLICFPYLSLSVSTILLFSPFIFPPTYNPDPNRPYSSPILHIIRPYSRRLKHLRQRSSPTRPWELFRCPDGCSMKVSFHSTDTTH